MSRKNVGEYQSALGQYAEALASHEENLALRTAKLGATHPDALESLANAARCLVLLDRGAEALPMIEDGIQRARSAKANAYVVFLMGLRFQYYIKVKDLAGCRSAAAALDTLDRTDAIGLYQTASAHAVVAGLIRNRDQSVEGEKQSNAEADLAMDWLRKALAAGFRETEHAANDRDLDVLRKRPDFIQWMADLAAAPKATGK